MSLYDAINGFSVQLGLCLIGLFSSSAGVYRAWNLNASDRKLPILLKILSCACLITANLRLVLILLPKTSLSWELIVLYISAIKIGTAYFQLGFALAITNFMAEICCDTTFESSIHSTSYFSLIAFAAIPACIRIIQNLYFMEFNVAVHNFNLQLNVLLKEEIQYRQFISWTIDLSVVIYFLIGMGILIYKVCIIRSVWKRVEQAELEQKLDKSGNAAKWRLFFSITWRFAAIIIPPLVRVILDDINELFQSPTSLYVAILLLIVPSFIVDTLGFLMCITLKLGRLQYCLKPKCIGTQTRKSLFLEPQNMNLGLAHKGIASFNPPLLSFNESVFYPTLANQEHLPGDFLQCNQSQSTLEQQVYFLSKLSCSNVPNTSQENLSIMFRKMEYMPKFEDLDFKELGLL